MGQVAFYQEDAMNPTFVMLTFKKKEKLKSKIGLVVCEFYRCQFNVRVILSYKEDDNNPSKNKNKQQKQNCM